MAKKAPHIEYEQIAAYLAGEGSPEERLAIENWIEASVENQTFFKECRKVFSIDYAEIESTEEQKGFDVRKAWFKVYSRMDLSDHSQTNLVTEPDMIPVEAETEPETVERTLFESYPWVRIAAVLVIGIAAVFFLINRSDNKVNTLAATDTIEEHYLSDSTRVVLAANASLSYRNNYGKGNRSVDLVGKAYFDVTRNEQLSFTISTKTGRIEVLGTAFVVEENTDSLYVIVERGKVTMRSLSSQDYLVLERNEQGVLDLNTLKLSKNTLENVNQLYWANKRLTYRQEQLSSVFNDLADIFNKEIAYDPVKLANCRITAVFMDQSLEEILKNMAISMDFEYSIDNDQVVIISDGCETE